MCQVIQLSDYIPRKDADRGLAPKREYRCADCARSLRVRRDEPHINCRCGAEMRPLEMEAK